MRFTAFLASLVFLVNVVVSAPAEDAPAEPEILVVASWPESNPFGHVVNGEKNLLLLNIENKSDKNVTLLSMAGSIHHAESNALIKNLTTAPYGITLIEGLKLQLPYTFYSEFKPGDLRLNIWMEHESEGEKYVVSAYDSIITIVEPELSIFDFKMITTYLMVLAIFGGIGYISYISFVPQSKKAKRADVSAPVGTVTATGAGGYQEEWIPDHHIRKSKKGGALSSGDELSGAETSGAEGKKRKAKK
ncbi:hypothetical protein CPB85DRAFT_616851 [Mucidula mucida]|nr:hypothetical protein CPB85DRAFT_616851 [Mucidula mucida]